LAIRWLQRSSPQAAPRVVLWCKAASSASLCGALTGGAQFGGLGTGESDNVAGQNAEITVRAAGRS
jgi:hypothetical protein